MRHILHDPAGYAVVVGIERETVQAGEQRQGRSSGRISGPDSGFVSDAARDVSQTR